MDIINKTILCVGEVLWDVLPDARKPGGAPLNVALHLARLEHKVQIVSRIGNDYYGMALLDFIRQNGLNTDHIQHDPSLPTSEVLVHLDENSNASFEIPGPVAWDNLANSTGLSNIVARAGIIIYGSLGSRNEVARSTIIKILKSSAVKIIDVNLRPPYTKKEIVKLMLLHADVAKLNDEELIEIAKWEGFGSVDQEQLMEWMLREYQLKIVIVTRGARGAIVYDGETFFQHPGFQVVVKDTVGAGDAFLAGFVSSMVNNKKTEDALHFACATGAFVASREGGTPIYQKSDIAEIFNT